MIVLDTNIVSEVMRPQPSSIVLAWLDQQDTQLLYLTTISLAEIRYGLAVMPDGERKRRLTSRFEAYVERAFEGRVLDFTATAASCYAELMSHRKKVGLPMSMADGQIAGIASEHHFAVATRNSKDFEQCGLELINPFVMEK